jgi:hypothetical protein
VDGLVVGRNTRLLATSTLIVDQTFAAPLRSRYSAGMGLNSQRNSPLRTSNARTMPSLALAMPSFTAMAAMTTSPSTGGRRRRCRHDAVAVIVEIGVRHPARVSLAGAEVGAKRAGIGIDGIDAGVVAVLEDAPLAGCPAPAGTPRATQCHAPSQ